MTERPNKITAEFVPAPELLPPPDKIIIRAPLDKRGFPIFHDLHLTIPQVIELDDALCAAMAVYEDRNKDA
jgi:hypothetical protein